jgi:hypothetical protein
MQQLMALLGISRPNLAQRLNAEPAIVRIGRAQRSRYALCVAEPISIYRIDAQGALSFNGRLFELSLGWYWQAEPESWHMRGDFQDGYYPDLPWIFQDLRPQGFLGRAFARQYATTLGFSDDPLRWTGAQLISALSRYGDDTTGNLLIGQAAAERYLQQNQTDVRIIPRQGRELAYAELANIALQEGIAGSSTAGEQPKFTVSLIEPDAQINHAIVKFSPSVDSAEAQRWRDLLRCEHWAAEALQETGLGAAKTELLEAENRLFLQSNRYDRVGWNGRRAQFSLGAFDDAFFGNRDNWFNAAARLQANAWLTPDSAFQLQCLFAFGLGIRNSDMHFGNISLIEGHQAPLALAPTYDMLPMQFRPGISGEILNSTPRPAAILPEYSAAFKAALPAIHAFRERFMADTRITPSFKEQLNRSLAI